MASTKKNAGKTSEKSTRSSKPAAAAKQAAAAGAYSAEAGKAQFDRFTQEAANAGREQAEALVESGTIFARGLEDFFKTYTALAQESVERNTQAFKALLSSKTLNEFTEAQNRLAQQNFDDFMTGVTRLSELGVRLATESLEPINDQIGRSVRKATDSLAA